MNAERTPLMSETERVVGAGRPAERAAVRQVGRGPFWAHANPPPACSAPPCMGSRCRQQSTGGHGRRRGKEIAGIPHRLDAGIPAFTLESNGVSRHVVRLRCRGFTRAGAARTPRAGRFHLRPRDCARSVHAMAVVHYSTTGSPPRRRRLEHPASRCGARQAQRQAARQAFTQATCSSLPLRPLPGATGRTSSGDGLASRGPRSTRPTNGASTIAPRHQRRRIVIVMWW